MTFPAKYCSVPFSNIFCRLSKVNWVLQGLACYPDALSQEEFWNSVHHESNTAGKAPDVKDAHTVTHLKTTNLSHPDSEGLIQFKHPQQMSNASMHYVVKASSRDSLGSVPLKPHAWQTLGWQNQRILPCVNRHQAHGKLLERRELLMQRTTTAEKQTPRGAQQIVNFTLGLWNSQGLEHFIPVP